MSTSTEQKKQKKGHRFDKILESFWIFHFETIMQNLAYQKATFLHGIDLFNMGDLDASKTFFQNSKEVNEDSKLTTQATFWLGDVYYKLKAFNLAEVSYNEVVNALRINKDEAYEIVNYNLGYVYFKTKSYDNAINSFNKWLKNSVSDTDSLILNDTYVRIADCYFVSSNYINAVEFYNKAIEIGKSEMVAILDQNG